jgi:transcriptional regulator with XRE-family HTH domain
MTPKQLRNKRKKAGMTQREIAEKLGVTVTSVARWEQGIHAIRLEHERAINELIIRELKKREGAA